MQSGEQKHMGHEVNKTLCVGVKVRIPELGNVVGTLEASRQGTRLVGSHYTRTWCVSLPRVESYIWLEESYLRPVGTVRGPGEPADG